jgi:putative aldouronate transport system substrate-binding protein
MTAKFISGELEINDANWNTYLAELEKMGLDEVLEVYTAAYERYLEK